MGTPCAGHFVRRESLADDVETVQKKNDRNEYASCD